MNRRGWPDMRCKRAAEYMAWVKEQEAAASKKIGEDLSHIINRISPKETPFVTLSRS
jgi:hypothetical protein